MDNINSFPNNNISNNLYSDYVDNIDSAESLICGDSYGCYYMTPGGKILWAGRNTHAGVNSFKAFNDDAYGTTFYGRYYTRGAFGNLRYIFTKGSDQNGYANTPYYRNCSGYNGYGFARKIYEGGTCCDAVCSWKGCGEPVTYNKDGSVKKVNYYLNGGDNKAQIEADYKANLKVYQKLVDDCNAAASCTTTSAEFSMSVNYKTGEENRTISFPYDENHAYTKENEPNSTPNNPDKLCSNGQKNCTSTYTNRNSTIIYKENPADGSQIAREVPDGCYDVTKKDDNVTNPNSTSNRIYRATITFPGAWINYKTGEITYKPVSASEESHWEHIENKFCIPREAKDVNTKYWLYYNTKDGKICNKQQSSMNIGDVEKWNIKATIKDFGLYAWDIDVSCFYALDEADNTCKENPTDVNTAYRIRSIDLTDMFPSTEGEATGGSGETGRDPGFNWTENAAVTKTFKSAYYTSNPTTLINNIQKVGYGVYSPKYLDYEFYLDKNTLREMRNSINDGNYTDFDEDGFKKSEVAGIGYYYSKKIRNLGKNKTPDPEIIDLVCNNLQLSDSGEYLKTCDVTNGESEE